MQRARDEQTGKFLSTEKRVVACNWCNKDFVLISGHDGTMNFCSRNCRNDYKRHERNNDRTIKKCEYCNNDFYVIPARKDTRFCSKKCYVGWQRQVQKYTTCLNCGKRFSTHAYRIRTFCSMECYRVFSHLASWNKDKIIQTITALGQNLSDLNAAYVRDTHGKLFKAAINHFGSWEVAVSSSGIQYESIRGDRKRASYKGLILQNIVKALYKEAKINVKEKPYLKCEQEACIPDFVEVDENKWVDVKLHSFSSGIDKTIRKYSKYTNDLIILYLLGPSREEDFTNVHFINIRDYFPSMHKQSVQNSKIRKELDTICKHYASYPWKLERMSRIWSKKKIKLKIRELHKNQISLNNLSMKKYNNDLFMAAIKSFKSWEEAVKSSGFDYDTIRKKRPKWTRDDILDSIKELEKSGADLNYADLSKIGKNKLYHAGCRLFGNWSFALSEAGVDLKKVNHPIKESKWSKDDILSEIKHLDEIAHNLAGSDIKKSKQDLYSAAIRNFGSWRSALEAAELDYTKIAKKERWSKEKILKEIESFHRSGISLSQRTLKAIGRYKLYDAAVRLFGSWNECLRVAGLNRFESQAKENEVV